MRLELTVLPAFAFAEGVVLDQEAPSRKQNRVPPRNGAWRGRMSTPGAPRLLASSTCGVCSRPPKSGRQNCLVHNRWGGVDRGRVYFVCCGLTHTTREGECYQGQGAGDISFWRLHTTCRQGKQKPVF